MISSLTRLLTEEPDGYGGYYSLRADHTLWRWRPGGTPRRVSIAGVLSHGEGLAVDSSGGIWEAGSPDWTRRTVVVGAREVVAVPPTSQEQDALPVGTTAVLYVLRDDGTVWSLKLEYNYDTNEPLATAPRRFGTLSGIQALSGDPALGAVVARRSDGAVFTWGASTTYPGNGRVGTGRIERASHVVASAVVSFSGGTFALQQGRVRDWGFDTRHSLGRSHAGSVALVPGRVGDLTGITGIASTFGLTFAYGHGRLFTWGRCGESL